MDVEKGWVFVAGASKGIGLSASRLLLDAGYGVIAAARNRKTLDMAFEGLESLPLMKIEWDFADIGKIEEKVKVEVFEKIESLAGLVCTLGAQKTMPLTMSKFQLAEELFKINTFAPIELVRVFAKFRKIHEKGASFILFSSLAAHEGAMGKSLYAASKGALEGFLRPASSEIACRCIRLNVLVPGIVKTQMSMEFIGKMTGEQIESLSQSYPLGLGEPEQVAGLVRFLISEESKWITGQTFILDGGHSVRGA